MTADLGVDVGDHQSQLETGHDAGVGQEGVELRNNHLTPHHSVLSNTCVVWVPVRLAKVRVGRDTVTGGTAATLTRTLECAVSGK